MSLFRILNNFIRSTANLSQWNGKCSSSSTCPLGHCLHILAASGIEWGL